MSKHISAKQKAIQGLIGALLEEASSKEHLDIMDVDVSEDYNFQVTVSVGEIRRAAQALGYKLTRDVCPMCGEDDPAKFEAGCDWCKKCRKTHKSEAT